jgi:PAS domain S-box-containing protein
MKAKTRTAEPTLSELRERAEGALRDARRAIEDLKESRRDKYSVLSSVEDIRRELDGIFEQQNELLHEARFTLQSLLEACPLAIISINSGLKVKLWSRSAERLFAWNEQEVLDRPLPTIPPDRLDEFLEKLVQQNCFDMTWVRQDQMPVSVCVWPLSMGSLSGMRRGTLLFVADIAERKQAEQTLRSQAEELARTNVDLEEFAYVASHDLQEPLRMVSLYTQFLAKRYQGRLDAEADEFIGYVVEGAKRMHQLINDLLAFARLGSQGQNFKLTDCEAVLEQAQSNLQIALKESGAKLTHDPLPKLMADPSQLSQLFQNLLDNAVKFRSEKPLQVHVSARREQEDWLFSVCDNGIGIDPQYTERIFALFRRLHGDGHYPGTGIGLAICKRIVERHGGRIWVKSQLGQGATFYFTLSTALRENPSSVVIRQ